LSSSAADLLRAAADRVVTDEDGNVNTIRLLAPLSEEEVAQLEARIPCVLPPDARELLTLARGFEGSPLESIDFSGLMDPIFEELFPCGLPVAHDGYGNYWVVDLTSSSGQWGPILYLCHDPAVVVYQCPDIATFVADVLIMAEPPHGGPIDAVHEEYSMRVWRENRGAMTHGEALSSYDADVRAFAEQLTPDHYVVDLRRAGTGDGFSWGRFGPKTPVCRAGEDRLFAYERHPKSFLGSLMGRG
jgi:cell wall assembly regulator SMI1